ncbi:MAG: IS21 family transposase [Methanoregula sp.]|jgi:transposase
MSEIKRIVELYKVQGSIREVSKQLGMSRNTVKKYLNRVQKVQNGIEEEILPTNRQIQRQSTVVTLEIRREIHRILDENQNRSKKQRWNGKKIWHHLVQSGHPIGYSTVTEVIAAWRKSNAHREVYILQDPDPGYRAEFDWGKTDLCIGGQWGKYPMATLVLNNSLYRFSRLYLRESLLEVIAAHIDFFQEIGGIPRTMFYDNMRTVIDPSTKAWNPRFLEFTVHYGFEPHACNVKSPHEKGTDEETIGYIRRTAFSEQNIFQSLDEANLYLSRKVDEINNHPVYRRKHVPQEGLEKERATLGHLPTLEFSNYLIRPAQISKYSLVLFESNYYSVPDEYRGKFLTLKIFPQRLELVNGDQVIASHIRKFGRGAYSLEISHYLKTLRRKPGALPHSKVFHQLHDAIQRVFHQHYLHNPKEFLPILSLVRESSVEGLISAIRVLEEHQMVPTYDTLKCVIGQQPFQMVEPLVLSCEVMVGEPNLSVYDNLMGV